MNCAIDDEVSRRWRFEASPLERWSIYPRSMTNHHRLRFVYTTYSMSRSRHHGGGRFAEHVVGLVVEHELVDV